MRSFLRLTFIAAVVGIFTPFSILPRATAEGVNQPTLCSVRKIHVGSTGDTDEAKRFRLLLEEQLSGKGFTVVERPEDADGVLTGVLSVRVHDKKTQARVYVKLSTSQGVRIWGKDFGSRITSPFNRTEPVKLRAQDVANALREECERSAKSGSVKPAP